MGKKKRQKTANNPADTIQTENNSIKKLIVRYLIPLFSIAGFLVSLKLAFIFFDVNFGEVVTKSFCSVNDYIDCDGVAKTNFSHFLGIPLALYGLFFYTLIFGISVFPFKKFKLFKSFNHPTSFICILSLISLLISIILAFISYVVIKKLCILCFATYFVNLFLFIVTRIDDKLIVHLNNFKKDTVSVLADKILGNLVIFGILCAIAVLIFTSQSNILILKPEQELKTSIKLITETENLGNILGSKKPALIIKDYSDFECPYCATLNGYFIKLAKDFDNIMILHYDFPLSSNCNPYVKSTGHKYSCKAALYARAAKEQGKYWDMVSLLFKNQKNLSDENLLILAKSLNLDIIKLKSYINDPGNLEKLKKEAGKGVKMGIKLTPTFYIGMKKYEGIMPYEELKQEVEKSLKQMNLLDEVSSP